MGGQIKSTVIHNGEALLNPAGALIEIERSYVPPWEDVHAEDVKAEEWEGARGFVKYFLKRNLVPPSQNNNP